MMNILIGTLGFSLQFANINQSWKLWNWIRSLYLNIHCGHCWFLLYQLLFPLFGYPCRIPTNKSSLTKWRAKFLISRVLIGSSGFCIHRSDWLKFENSPGYKLKIEISLKLTKQDQAFISITTNLKFSAM